MHTPAGLLAPQRHGRVAPVIGVLQWKVIYSLGRTTDEKVNEALPRMGEETIGSLWVNIKGRAGRYEVTVGVCYMQLTRKTEHVRPSVDRQEEPHIHKP